MFIHYNNGESEKLIKNVLCVNIIDGANPAYVTLTDGKELRIRLDHIETICDDGVLEKERKNNDE